MKHLSQSKLMIVSFTMAFALVGAGFAAVFTGCASGPKSETAGQYVDDSTITAKVKAAVLDEPSLKVFQIGVETYKGVVQLSGFVDSEASVKRAGEVAGKIEGVKSVKNNLAVKV